MTLQELVLLAPGNNSAFELTDKMSLNTLVESCNKIGKTRGVDLHETQMEELTLHFDENEIIVLKNVEYLDKSHELLYRLSGLLDLGSAYVFCVVSDKSKFNALQTDRYGPLYLRWFWIDDFNAITV